MPLGLTDIPQINNVAASHFPHHAKWRELLADECSDSQRWIEHHGKPVCLNDEVNCPEAEEWDRHWHGLTGSLRGRLFSLYRWQIRSRCVANAIAKHFTAPGVYVECGCGSSETSCRIRPQPGQTFLALDFAARPLGMALRQPCHSGGLQADIRRLPFRDQSLDGLWNLGVMEHFEEDEQLLILREFHRVLKPGGEVLLWWPPTLAFDRLLLGPFGWQFPAEPGRATSAVVKNTCRLAGYTNVEVSRPWSDCGTELLVHAASASC